MRYARQNVFSRRVPHCAFPLRIWCVIGLMVSIGIWTSGEAWAVNVSPTAVTFYAIEGTANPSSQIVSVSKSNYRQAYLTATDNASWLAVSPSNATMMSTVEVLVAANISGLRAGTYAATVTIKLSKGGSTVVPVTLSVLPATTLSTASTAGSTTTPTATSTTGSTTTSTTISTTTTTTVSSTKSASVAWDPVVGTNLAGYKVYVGMSPGVYGMPIDVGNVTSYVVNSLFIGATYYVVVTSYNSSGLESSPSTEVSKTIN